MNKFDGNTLFDIGLCPVCGSDKCKVSKTMKPMRKLYCQECNVEWSTITINLFEPDALEQVARIAKAKAEMDEKYPFL